jgi:nitrous oxide reductase accessory protein NosL
MSRSVRFAWLLAAALALGACARAAGPPPIVLGSECAACGMEIQDLRFACEQSVDDKWRAYDAIECLLRERVGPAPATRIYLADYDRRTLHHADSVWVVHGNLSSPMGGGYASFRDRASADEVAAQVTGRVARFSELRGAGSGS